MRWRGVHHVELSVLDYERSIAFYDRMFGWLGYKSFWTLDIGYRSTYYMARFPLPHSYIGVQPARTGARLNHDDHATGIHHVALWARNRREVDAFYTGFLTRFQVPVSDPPAAYPTYSPGYYAVFFDDPVTGIHWELAHTPLIPTLPAALRWLRALKAERARHPEWQSSAIKEAMRPLPSKSDLR